MSGLPVRIFSRRSFCRPFITPMMTTSALTATRHAAHRDEADERQQLRAATAPQVSPGERQLETAHSGRSVGKRITSRMFGVFVRYMNSRSIPMPTPPIGGMPYSIARR